MLVTAAILGWLAALVLAILRWRHTCSFRERVVERVVYQPATGTAPLPMPMETVPARVPRVGRWRRLRAKLRQRPSVISPAHSGAVMALYSADGELESVRRLTGAPPPTIHRPHGRGPATVYRFCGTDGTQARYQAEA